MSLSNLHLMALANFALCGTAAVICLCRLVAMNPNTTSRFIFRYALLLTAASASGIQPTLFGEWPGWADLLMTTALLVFLATSSRAWRGGPPVYTIKRVRDEYLPSINGGKR